MKRIFPKTTALSVFSTLYLSSVSLLYHFHSTFIQLLKSNVTPDITPRETAEISSFIKHAARIIFFPFLYIKAEQPKRIQTTLALSSFFSADQTNPADSITYLVKSKQTSFPFPLLTFYLLSIYLLPFYAETAVATRCNFSPLLLSCVLIPLRNPRYCMVKFVI